MRFLLNNKVWTLLGNTADFFFACSEWKLLFQQFEVDRLSLKLAAIFARPKQRCDVTGSITLMARWKFRVIMGEETSVQSPRKHSLGHLRAVKQLITVALDLEEVMHLSAAIPGGWPRGTPGHLHQDIYKFHLSRASILPQKATTVPPPGSIIWKDSQIVT